MAAAVTIAKYLEILVVVVAYVSLGFISGWILALSSHFF